jgi:flagellar biosynthesis protein FlhF
MQEALAVVRREMGPDAVILHTREVPKSKLLGWLRNQERVEITAGLGVNIRPPAARFQTKPEVATASTATTNTAVAAALSPYDDAASPPRRPLDRTLAPPPPLLPARDGASRLSTPPAAPAADSWRLRQMESEARIGPERPSESPVQNEQHAALNRQLDSIRQMVEKLSRNTRPSSAQEIPPELFQLYTDLIDTEVEEDLAQELISRLKQNLPERLSNAAAAKPELHKMLEAEIRCTRAITVTPGRRKVIALVGPTGVGKTTTIAKLAANFRLRQGVKMGLVTVDTYRIAAVEQLRTYAEIIDLPMKVVTSPREMRRALDELAGLDLVLIDTAGRSPRDELKIQELKSLLAEARVDEVHLVLSLVASARSLEATAEKFAVANTTSMILTKLDEAAGMGTLLSVARKIPLPISYLTTGQDVPDDIEAASASRISRLVLGDDRLFAKSNRRV